MKVKLIQCLGLSMLVANTAFAQSKPADQCLDPESVMVTESAASLPSQLLSRSHIPCANAHHRACARHLARFSYQF